MTEWGRYRYLRAPQGFLSSRDAYTKRFDDITEGIKNKTQCVDDALLWEDTLEESFWAAVRYIDICARGGVVFNLRWTSRGSQSEKPHFAQRPAC